MNDTLYASLILRRAVCQKGNNYAMYLYPGHRCSPRSICQVLESLFRGRSSQRSRNHPTQNPSSLTGTRLQSLSSYILLRGASAVCLNLSLLNMSNTFSEVSRFFFRPKCAHFGSSTCLRFSRLTSIVLPTPVWSYQSPDPSSSRDAEGSNLVSHAHTYWPSYPHHSKRVSSGRPAKSPRPRDPHLVSVSNGAG